jgi:hypothetical protein
VLAAAVVLVALAAVGATAAFVAEPDEGGPTAAASSAPSTDEATTTVPMTSTTVAPATTIAAPPPCDRRPELDVVGAPVGAALDQRTIDALADPRWVGLDRSISVWVEGRGEVVDVGGDTALLPASNQKLLTAIGAHLLLDPEDRFRTEVRDAGDHLVLVAGGDPTLRSAGPHSLRELARQVATTGRTTTAGLVVDASTFEPATAARGWQDWQIPTYVGPMSALVVDDNRARTDPAFLADPAIGNGEVFGEALAGTGVAVVGPVVRGDAPTGAPVVAELWSPTVAELTRTMLQRSDNEIAESLVRRIVARPWVGRRVHRGWAAPDPRRARTLVPPPRGRQRRRVGPLPRGPAQRTRLAAAAPGRRRPALGPGPARRPPGRRGVRHPRRTPGQPVDRRQRARQDRHDHRWHVPVGSRHDPGRARRRVLGRGQRGAGGRPRRPGRGRPLRYRGDRHRVT